jgi:TnpA family transposase
MVGRAIDWELIAAQYDDVIKYATSIKSAALNVAESWNAGNAVLHYGKGGDIPGNRRDEQELTVLCLRVLQASVSFLNTLLIQDVLDGGDLRLAAEDQRAITPLFWSHIALYGEATLDMTRRISLNGDAIPDGEQAGT